MLVVILNQSKQKSFRKSKRTISSVFPTILPRMHLGDIPKRVLWTLITNLRAEASRGTVIKIFIEDTGGYHGWKCLEIGRHANHLDEFMYTGGTLDEELKLMGWLSKPPSLKPSKKSRLETKT